MNNIDSFEDLYNFYKHLNYLRFNINKKLKENNFINYLKKNQKFNNLVKKMILDNKLKTEKENLYIKLILIFKEYINLNINNSKNKLNILENKIKFIENWEKYLKYENYLSKVKMVDKLLINNFLKNYNKNYLIFNEKEDEIYTFYKKYIKNFFNDLKNEEINYLENNVDFIKKHIKYDIKKYILEKKDLSKKLNNFYKLNNLITDDNKYYYLSAYNNFYSKNIIEVLNNFYENNYQYIKTKNLDKIITEKYYKIYEPIILFDKNNKIKGITSYYSPKIWNINNEKYSDIIDEYNSFIRINYSFNITNKIELNIINKFYKNITSLKKKKKSRIFKTFYYIGEEADKISNKIKLQNIKYYINNFKNKYKIILQNKEIIDSFVFVHLLNTTDEKLLLQNYKNITQNFEKKLLDSIFFWLENFKSKVEKKKRGFYNFNILGNNLFQLNKILVDKISRRLFGETISVNKKNFLKTNKIFYNFFYRNKNEIENSKRITNDIKNNLKLIEKIKNKKKKNINDFIEINQYNNLINNNLTYLKQIYKTNIKLIKNDNSNLIYIIKFIDNIIKMFSNLKKNINNSDIDNFNKLFYNGKEILSLNHQNNIKEENFINNFENIYPENFFILLSYFKEKLYISNKFFKLLNSIILKKYKDLDIINIDKLIQSIGDTNTNTNEFIWLWKYNYKNNYIIDENENIVNRYETFMKNYPFLFIRRGELSDNNQDNTPIIMKWLFEKENIGNLIFNFLKNKEIDINNYQDINNIINIFDKIKIEDVKIFDEILEIYSIYISKINFDFNESNIENLVKNYDLHMNILLKKKYLLSSLIIFKLYYILDISKKVRDFTVKNKKINDLSKDIPYYMVREDLILKKSIYLFVQRLLFLIDLNLESYMFKNLSDSDKKIDNIKIQNIKTKLFKFSNKTTDSDNILYDDLDNI